MSWSAGEHKKIRELRIREEYDYLAD